MDGIRCMKTCHETKRIFARLYCTGSGWSVADIIGITVVYHFPYEIHINTGNTIQIR